MKELETLLNRRWVLKSEDRELYYKIRDSIGEIRKFATEKMGCQVIENALLVKMEKIPALPETCMGIDAFASKEEYAFLCILLMFLEDRDAQEQFILSQLTEYIAANMPGEGVDWTLYTSRRRLVKVLRYAADQGILRVTDGSDDAFMDQETGEVCCMKIPGHPDILCGISVGTSWSTRARKIFRRATGSPWMRTGGSPGATVCTSAFCSLWACTGAKGRMRILSI